MIESINSNDDDDDAEGENQSTYAHQATEIERTSASDDTLNANTIVKMLV